MKRNQLNVVNEIGRKIQKKYRTIWSGMLFMKKRLWHIFRINCDCAAFHDARQRMSDPMKFMRCKLCGAKLGDMQVEFLGSVRENTEMEAIQKIREIQNGKRC